MVTEEPSDLGNGPREVDGAEHDHPWAGSETLYEEHLFPTSCAVAPALDHAVRRPI
uniref:Uncharacterized protein n=1 Tax=Mycobacterium sp. (strain JS330) TaxID=1004011 RepID=F4ZCI9_MYCS0|nr:hypothetical protein [Mycobacterium sp. JS330]